MTKSFNLNPQVVFTLGKLDLYSEARYLLLRGLEIVPLLDNIIEEMNVTSAISVVSVHYDEDLIISLPERSHLTHDQLSRGQLPSSR